MWITEELEVGEEFKKMTYQKLGHYETIDQINAAKYFGNWTILIQIVLAFLVGHTEVTCLHYVY